MSLFLIIHRREIERALRVSRSRKGRRRRRRSRALSFCHLNHCRLSGPNYCSQQMNQKVTTLKFRYGRHKFGSCISYSTRGWFIWMVRLIPPFVNWLFTWWVDVNMCCPEGGERFRLALSSSDIYSLIYC